MEHHNVKKNSNTVDVDFALSDLTPEQEKVVNMMYPGVCKNVAARVANKTELCWADAQDIAAAAALYALRSYVTGNRSWPETWEDWANQATWKATNLALDLIDHMKHTPMAYFDEVFVRENGEPINESPVEIQASVQAWRNRQAEEERRYRCAAVRYAVPKVVHDMGTKNELRTLKIVKAVCFSQLPVAEVCQRFEGLKPNHLYQILFRFRACFAKVGKGYMDEFLDNYSDSVLEAA